MPAIGYALASEDWPGRELVRLARRAEDSGFEFALISDHFHPWIDAQGESPFVWSVIGGIAAATERIRLGTGVTCPTMRIHPAVVAQAAATCAELMPGRFFLGIGTGENLNEHVLGDRWPPADERLEMLEEAVEVMRLLWQGGERTHRGRHYTVDHARLYTLPDEPPPIAVAAARPRAAELAGRLGDALINTAPDAEIVEVFRRAGGAGKPCYGMIHACFGPDETEALETAHRLWPNIALEGELPRELPRPVHFEDASRMVTKEKLAEMVPCGPDPERHLETIRRYEEAGFDHVWVHQIGADQEGFLDFYAREILPQA
ncbi:MAG TPA: TIGR03557 family F420-dependent LLM class oxidoreductase [Gaiellaceae bacterium]|nr:TIGR03557 family F420-dependent LLM class oxidoreductase [Gaiellaceae bacterium]